MQPNLAVLERRISHFRVKNAPIQVMTYALNPLGIRVCMESVPAPSPVLYIDREGYSVFPGPVYSVEAEGASVRELLGKIVKAAPEYQWELIPETDLINLFPKANSRLTAEVPAFKASGRFDEILLRPALDQVPPLVQRGPDLPEIELTFRGGTVRGVLNEMVRGVPGFVWGYSGNVLTFSTAFADEPGLIVDVAYDVRRGEPIAHSPDFQTASYEIKTVADGAARRLQVVRYPIDLAEREAKSRPEPERALVRQFVGLVRAMLREDVEAFMASVHPEGVRDGTKLLSHADLESGLTRAFEKKDYTKLHLADVLDLKQIQVEAKPNGRYRVATKPKIKYIDGQLYFDDELWFTFEKSKDGKWRIVELD
jgi:hypothetical protein